MQNIWITGAAGRVGTALKKALDCTQYRVLATDAAEVDVADLKGVHAYMYRNRPDIVINCAGLTDLEACNANPDKAYLINALGARNLAQESNAIGAEIIHISTDDIFGASNEPKNEFDPPAPRSVYGKSKLAGERLVSELNDRHVILRSSWVYGSGTDFVSTLLHQAQQGNIIAVPGDQFGSPTSAAELAAVILDFIENENYGVYHAVCKGSCSRYEFAQEILNRCGLAEQVTLQRTTGGTGGRPDSAVLDTMMLRLSHMREPAAWQEALAVYLTALGVAR